MAKHEEEKRGNITPADIAGKITLAGDPLPIDPDTGEIDMEKLTDEQRAEIEAAAESIAAIKPLIKSINLNLKGLTRFLISDETRQALKDISDDLQAIRELNDELDELKPYIDAELKADEYEEKTLDDFLDGHTWGNLLEMRHDLFSPFYKAVERARAAKAAAEPANITRAEIIEYPLDKPNSHIWNLLEKDTRGQIKFDLLPKQPDLNATAIYSINFDDLADLEITKRLQPYDKRVYIAASALYNAGNKVITLTQIYYAMGYTGRPNARALSRINDALTKMLGAKILFDNKQEAEALPNYKHFKYDGSLLPFERLTAVVNGQVTDAAIRIFREPPLMTFAKQRQQVTTISVKLLQSPLNKTDNNLQIDDYLLERIGKAKRGSGNNCRILYKTLFERTGTTQKKQKQRAPGKVKQYLDYYQQQGFIKKYTEQADGVTVFF